MKKYLASFIYKLLYYCVYVMFLQFLLNIQHFITCDAYHSLNYLGSIIFYMYLTDCTFVFTAKITLCLMFLITIRGCVPRYRYDFLTKMG